MDEKSVILVSLTRAVNNRIHAFQHSKMNMFAAAKDIWYTYVYRSIALITEICAERTAAGKPLVGKKVEKIIKPK